MTVDSNYNTAAKVGAALGGTWEVFGKGKTLVGVDTSDTDFDTVEETGGAKTHSIEVSNLPVHNHSIPSLSGTAASNGAHSHGLKGGTAGDTQVGSYIAWSNPVENFANSGKYWIHNTMSAGAHTHSVTTNASNTTGCTDCSGTALSTQDAYITVYMYKRTA